MHRCTCTQTTTSGWAEVTGSRLRTDGAGALSYLIANNSANSLDYQVQASNRSSFPYPYTLTSGTVAPSGVGSYTETPPAFGFVNVLIRDTAPGDSAEVVIDGIAKP
jgi:hypothetical protein